MFDQQGVEAIFQAALAKAKPFLKDSALHPKAKNGEVKYPELWEGQDDAWEEKAEMLVHIEQGHDGKDLLLQQAPNQTKEELEYVRKNARQITLPVYQDYENTLRRALSDGNWQITYNGDTTAPDSFAQYVNNGIDEFDSVLNFVRYMLPKLKTLDPMGLLVVTPGELPTTEDGEGNVVIDGSEAIKPQVEYVPVEKVWGFRYDRWYLYQTNEYSIVTEGNKQVAKGIVLRFSDDVNTWRIEQYGDLKDYTFRTFVEFQHDMGYPPCDHLKGVPVFDGAAMVHQSHFLVCKELLDLAFIDAQRLQVVKNCVAYPHKVMIGDDCDFTDPVNNVGCMGNGVLRIPNDSTEGYREVKCPRCQGTGVKSRMSPMGVLLIRPRNDAGNGEGGNAAQSIYFVEPSTANMEFLAGQVQHNINAARSILHLQSETAEAGGVQPETATGGGLRNRSTIAFIKPIADQIFNTIDFLLDAIGRMRYGAEFGTERVGYVLMRPVSIDLRTEEDMIDEINTARESGLPQSVIDRMVWQYISLRYQTSPEAMDAFEVIAQADRLMSLDPMQVQSEATAGRAQPWEVVLHWSALSIYEELIQTSPAFVKMDAPKKAAAMKEKARMMIGAGKVVQMAPAVKAVVDGTQPKQEAGKVLPITGAQGGEAVQDTALNGAQVASLVEIINQVATGIITRETAKPLIQAAFPGIEDALVETMLAGVKAVDVTKVAEGTK